jgi:hypothetical protein
MSSRSLAVLVALASPLIGVAAVVGWLTGAWPATPLTFMLSATAVVGGPLLALVHVATADEPTAPQPAPSRTPAPSRPRAIALDGAAVTPRLVAARQFHNWRERENESITLREREELLRRNQYIARRLRRARAL